MSRSGTQQLTLLFVGPIVLVAASYWLTFCVVSDSASAHPPPVLENAAEFSVPAESVSTHELDGRCRQRAEELQSLLDDRCNTCISAPYVLLGDLPRTSLERYDRDVIRPIERVLTVAYFDRLPDEPVVIVLCASNESYQTYSRRFGMALHAGYYGYYDRSQKLAVLNAASGEGTLAHELTHILAHFDFPDLPEWLDEGLASLHEESRFSDDELKLIGVSNWRLNYLKLAIRQEKLPSLGQLLSDGSFDGQSDAVAYAQARYFCMYLQERGLLRVYYRKLRANRIATVDAKRILLEILNVDSIAAVDRDFRAWLETIST